MSIHKDEGPNYGAACRIEDKYEKDIKIYIIHVNGPNKKYKFLHSFQEIAQGESSS